MDNSMPFFFIGLLASVANGEYMLMASLAWNLKAWLEFRTFVNYIVRVPAQVVKSGRQLIVRLLAWNDWQPVFMRLAERLMTALTAPRSERQRC